MQTNPTRAATDAPTANIKPDPAGTRRWLARAGAVGVLFFLAKGLAWLAAPLVVWSCAN